MGGDWPLMKPGGGGGGRGSRGGRDVMVMVVGDRLSLSLSMIIVIDELMDATMDCPAKK